MPTRTQRKHKARGSLDRSTYRRAWTELPRRHCLGSPSARNTHSSHLGIIADTFYKCGRHVRPHNLTPQRISDLLSYWRESGISTATIRRCLVTFRWIGKVTVKPWLTRTSDSAYLSGDALVGHLMANRRIANYLRVWSGYILLARQGSRDRPSHLRIFAETFCRHGYELLPKNIRCKHIDAALRAWAEEGIRPHPIENRLAALRWFAPQIGKKNLLKRRNDEYLEPLFSTFILRAPKARDLPTTNASP